jgi:WD40 repeat protein
MSYDVFISYSYEGDDLLSQRVQDGLQRIAKPWWKRRSLTVFRDQTTLSANPGLWSSIADAIDESQYFLMLASPEAAASPWVAREVAQWRARRGSDGLLLLLTSGEIVWDDAAGDFDADASTALGAAFASCFAEEPRYVDMRWARSELQLDLTNGRFRDQIAELAAPVHGMAKDELAGVDVRQHRRTIRHAFAAGISLVLLTLAAVATSVFAVNAAASARHNASRARAEEKRANVQATLASSARADAEKQTAAAVRNAKRARVNALRADAEKRSADASAASAQTQRRLADVNAQQARANEQQAQENLALAVRAQLEVADKNQQLQDTNGQLSAVNGQLSSVNGQLSTVNGQLSTTNRQLHTSNASLAESNAALTEQRNQVARQRDLAQSHSLAAGAVNAYSRGRFDLGLLLAAESTRIEPDAQARGSLLSGLRLQSALVGHLHGLTGEIRDVAYSPDGSMLAAVTLDGRVGVWDLHSRLRIAHFAEPTRGCDISTVIVFSPDSRTLAVTVCGGDVDLRDPRNGNSRQVLHNPGTTANSLSFDATGAHLAVGGDQLTIWDVNAAQIVQALPPDALCNQGTLSPDGTVVACAFYHFTDLIGAPLDDVSVQLWSAQTGLALGPPVAAYSGFPYDGRLSSFSFSSDSKTLTSFASALGVRPLMRWDVVTGEPTGAAFGALLAPDQLPVAVSPDLTQLVSYDAADQSLTVRDASSGTATSSPLRIPVGGSIARVVVFSPDGQTLAAGESDGPVRLWQPTAPTRLATTLPIAVAGDDRVTLSPDGRTAEVTQAGTTRLIDVASGSPLTHQPSEFGVGAGTAMNEFSGDGRTFLWIGSDHKIRRWDLGNGRVVGPAVPLPTDCFFLLAVTVDARAAAVSCGFYGDVKVFDLDSARVTSEFVSPDRGSLGAFSPDGRLLALGGTVVELWNVSARSLTTIQPRQGQLSFPQSLAFSPDGRTLAAGGTLDGPVIFWDVATGLPRHTISEGFTIDSLENIVVAFSPDGRTLAAGNQDGSVQLWDVASSQPIGAPLTRLPVVNGAVQGQSAAVLALAFAADGESIVSANLGTTRTGVTVPNEVVRWDLRISDWQDRACTIANRNLTAAEWKQFVGNGTAYRRVCPALP